MTWELIIWVFIITENNWCSPITFSGMGRLYLCVCVGYIYKLFCLLNIRNFIRWSAAVHQVLILYIYNHSTQAYVVPPWFLSKVRECEAWVSTESSKHADILFISYLCSQDKCPNDCDFLEDDPKSPNEM